MLRDYFVKPSRVSGEIIAPPSKSQMLRAILFATMAQGISECNFQARNIMTLDAVAMIDACRKLGAEITVFEQSIKIKGVAGNPCLPDDVIHVGNSGLVLRFVASIAALMAGYSIFTGDHAIRFNRPIQPLMKGLCDLGAECISTKGDGHAPMILKGPIQPGRAILDGQDSQPVSGLLIASAFLNGCTEITVKNSGEHPWIGLTLEWLDRFGIRYTNQDFKHYEVHGGQTIPAFQYTVSGDFSGIAFPMAAALVTHSALKITGIDMTDPQGDKKIIDILLNMGADIHVHQHSIEVLPTQTLTGCDIDVNDIIDALPILAVIACFAEGQTRLTNAAIARTKECDRLSAITSELRAMGASIVEEATGLTITGTHLKGAEVHSHEDHRIAMALTVAALGATTPSRINNTHCVAKTYPDFFTDMRSVGATLKCKN